MKNNEFLKTVLNKIYNGQELLQVEFEKLINSDEYFYQKNFIKNYYSDTVSLEKCNEYIMIYIIQLGDKLFKFVSNPIKSENINDFKNIKDFIAPIEIIEDDLLYENLKNATFKLNDLELDNQKKIVDKLLEIKNKKVSLSLESYNIILEFILELISELSQKNKNMVSDHVIEDDYMLKILENFVVEKHDMQKHIVDSFIYNGFKNRNLKSLLDATESLQYLMVKNSIFIKNLFIALSLKNNPNYFINYIFYYISDNVIINFPKIGKTFKITFYSTRKFFSYSLFSVEGLEKLNYFKFRVEEYKIKNSLKFNKKILLQK